jgi:hypothetical protein
VGALVPVGEAGGFADALVALAGFSGPALRQRAARHFRRQLSFAAVGSRLLDAYRKLLESR